MLQILAALLIRKPSSTHWFFKELWRKFATRFFNEGWCYSVNDTGIIGEKELRVLPTDVEPFDKHFGHSTPEL